VDYVANRTILGVGIEKLDFFNLMKEQKAKNGVPYFMNRGSNPAGYDDIKG